MDDHKTKWWRGQFNHLSSRPLHQDDCLLFLRLCTDEQTTALWTGYLRPWIVVPIRSDLYHQPWSRWKPIKHQTLQGKLQWIRSVPMPPPSRQTLLCDTTLLCQIQWNRLITLWRTCQIMSKSSPVVLNDNFTPSSIIWIREADERVSYCEGVIKSARRWSERDHTYFLNSQ